MTGGVSLGATIGRFTSEDTPKEFPTGIAAAFGITLIFAAISAKRQWDKKQIVKAVDQHVESGKTNIPDPKI